MKKRKTGEIIPLSRNFMFIQVFYYHNGVERLERFISDYLGLPYEKVHNHITLLPRDAEKDKRLTADMQLDLVLDLDDNKINIELNNSPYTGLRERNLTYAELLGGHQYKKIKGRSSKEIYKDIKATLQINLNYFGNNDRLITRFKLVSEETSEIFSENLRIDNVDMTKINDKNYKCKSEIEEKVYLWCKLINTNNIYIFKEICAKLLPRDEAERVVELVEYLSSDEEMYLLGDEEDQEELIKAAKLDYAIKEASKKAIEQGIEQNKKESAIEFHKNGVSDELIINSLHITKEKLDEYLNNEY